DTTMAQYYTLEEAADKLGLTPDAFRKRLATEWKTTPRRYPDGATLRFQVREIDELARSLGRGSDPDVGADEPIKLADDTSSDECLRVVEGSKKPAGRAPDSDIRLQGAPDSDVRLQGEERPAPPAGRGNHPLTEEIDLDAEQRAKPPSSK